MAGVASSSGIELTRIAVFTVAGDGSITPVANSPFALDATDPNPSGFVIAQ
jgi:hypothetical protein